MYSIRKLVSAHKHHISEQSSEDVEERKDRKVRHA